MKPILILAVCIFISWMIIFLSCKKEYSCESCREKNKPPTANAGSDQVITLPTDSVLLDGSLSSDPDGRISEWLWTRISGPASFNIINSSDSITKVKALVVGTYQFELKVTDEKGLSAKDTMKVIVDSVASNHPPIANAGNDVNLGACSLSELVNGTSLDGSGSSDPDNNIISYSWRKISGPPLPAFNITNATGAQILITDLQAGIAQFELTVTDAGGLFSKDTAQVRCFINDNSPIANAGTDQAITLPANAITLNGSGSTDLDNNITSYTWTKIAGPSSLTIINSSAIQTQVTGLVQGVYQFELKVTDTCGLFSKDTMQATVNNPPSINCDTANRPKGTANLNFLSQLPEPRYDITVAAAGNKIFVAGGYGTTYPAANFSNRVDIYDVSTGQWTTTHLSEPRVIGGVAVLGNKVFFAGGWYDIGWNRYGSTTVDIYDVSTNTWSTAQLSQARGDISCGTINNKAFFAGGFLSDRVDIYDAPTNTWSNTSLSEARFFITVTTVGNKIFFAGGNCTGLQDCGSNKIDIYDAATNTWAYEDYIPQNGLLLTGTAADNKNYWVTGDYWDGGNLVEIRDEITHTTSYECLSGRTVSYSHSSDPINNGAKLIFPVLTTTPAGGLTQFDVYDLATNTWSIQKLPSYASLLFITVNNEVYAVDQNTASGKYDKVYKLEF